MRVDSFDYELPPELIAQSPAEDREQARLLVFGEGDSLEHRHVADLADLIPPGALVVVNDTRVIPARLLGTKAESGGKVEVFLVRHVEDREIDVGTEGTPSLRKAEIWRALGRSSKPLRFGSDILVGEPDPAKNNAHRLIVRLLGRADDGLLEVALFTAPDDNVQDALLAVGQVPLPPYIKRAATAGDVERYQTVFARTPGAVAAPTAGLHLTRALLGRLAIRGVEVTTVTLHVGLGTFQPVTVEDLDDHPMHGEMYTVSRTAAEAIKRTHAAGKPVVAIGTTVVRALESAADPDHPGEVRAQSGETRLLIQPGFEFRVVDRLVTNFHLPKSTLLAMVSAFAGTERVLAGYRAAVAAGYRFFSYGDAMWLTRAGAP